MLIPIWSTHVSSLERKHILGEDAVFSLDKCERVLKLIVTVKTAHAYSLVLTTHIKLYSVILYALEVEAKQSQLSFLG